MHFIASRALATSRHFSVPPFAFTLGIYFHNIEIPLASRRGKAQPEPVSSQNSCGQSTRGFVPNCIFGLRTGRALHRPVARNEPTLLRN